MNIKDLCNQYGITQTELARRFGIPLRTVQGWYLGERRPPSYVPGMIAELLELDREYNHKSGRVALYSDVCNKNT